MARPLIGIATSQSADGSSQQLDRRYAEAVEAAGGCPVLLPMVAAPETLEPLVGQLGGLLLTGGPGISDGLVGQLPADLPPVDPLRDDAEKWIYARMTAAGRPVLGICYGMQFINARCGGTLLADVERQRGVGPHSPLRAGGKSLLHPVEPVAGTCLAGLVGEARLEANSSHIQAVDKVGAGLRIGARSADGLVEALESEDGRILGVQFHPERLRGSPWDRLFEHLVQAAR